jgi:O-antigen/teichoic acid export membrane protein
LKLDLTAAATAPASTFPGMGAAMLRTAWARLLRTKSASIILGCGDQAVVSVSSFAALVMVGRWTDPSQLGAYAVGLSVLALVLAAQEALVARPYSIYLHRPDGTPAEHAFNSLVLSALLGLAAALSAGTLAMLLSSFNVHRGLVEIAWVIAGTVPLVLLRDFARRFAFAHLKISMALKIDVATGILTVGAIGMLGWAGQLSAATALAAVGVSCGLAAFGWLYLARAEFAFGLRQLAATFRRSWELGKWFLSGMLAVQAQGYMIQWLALAITGAAVTGVYAACASIVAFANPIIYGFCNVLTPKYVHTLKTENVLALRRRVAHDALLLATAMGVFCIAIFAVGDETMRLLYQAPEYTGHGTVLAVLSVAALAAAAGIPASLALAAAERARTLAVLKAASAVLTLLLVSALLPPWGLLGAGFGILAAEVAGSIGQWAAFLLLVPRPAVRGELT